MELNYLSFQGPVIDDEEVFRHLPTSLQSLLSRINGFIQFGGGLHIRGACLEPEWHALAHAWKGEKALWRLYPALTEDDVPFGQDALGDQFILRDEVVHQLASETGDLTSLDVGFYQFLKNAQADPLNYLALQPLVQFQNEGGSLEPGQLLSVYPPFCIKQQTPQYSYRAISVEDRIAFLSSFAAQISSLPDGASIRFEVTPEEKH